MGCPKFDDGHEYVSKFADIFRIAGIKSVTTVVMEVPCCAGMPMIIKKGMDAANKKIPMKEIVLSLRGKILKRS
jgi:Ni,Fe-hydrogenase III small subunit